MRNARFYYLITIVSVIVSCATLPTDFERPESYALSDTSDTTFGTAVSEKAKGHPGQSGFHLLGNGLDAFVARAVLAQFCRAEYRCTVLPVS
jgi:putative cardiolipin synthase